MIRQHKPHVQFHIVIGKGAQSAREGTSYIAQPTHFDKRLGFRRKEEYVDCLRHAGNCTSKHPTLQQSVGEKIIHMIDTTVSK